MVEVRHVGFGVVSCSLAPLLLLVLGPGFPKPVSFFPLFPSFPSFPLFPSTSAKAGE